METIRVELDPNDIRDVIANGNTIGQTETNILVTANFYVIRLSGTGYKPPEWRGQVAGTTPTDPLVITFHRTP
jgi:hypothetical protein